jgi:glycosyltransferase involved in cell wall biosynthesis
MAASLRHPFEQTLRDFRPGIILSSWIYPDSCAALHLNHGRVPLVAIAQGSDVHRYLNIPARRRIILKYLPHAAAVITRSNKLSRILEQASFPREKLHTVYNGVCLDTFQPRDQATARRDSGLPDKARILLFVGNFYPVKNPLLLIRAFALLNSGGPPTLLVMAGGGPLEQACRVLADHLGVADRVIFAGRKKPEEVAHLMNCADVLVVPSENEGVPNVILEAFASGLPVVATDVGGVPEVLDHGSLGSLSPAGDVPGLAAAIELQLVTPRDTAAIRLRGERFSWERAARRYHDLLMGSMRGMKIKKERD